MFVPGLQFRRVGMFQLIPNYIKSKQHVRIEPSRFEVEFFDLASRLILRIYDLMMYASAVESMDL